MKTTLPSALLFSLFSGLALAGADKPQEEVSKANWLSPEVSTWTFQNTSQLIPAAVISTQGQPVKALGYNKKPLDDLKVDVTVDGRTSRVPFSDYLTLAETDSIIVLHKGKIVFEDYFNGMTPEQRHIVMSVTKSFVGALTVQLITEGKLDASASVESVLTSLKGTDVGAASIGQVLDMTAGLKYSEDYADPKADVWSYVSSIGLLPRPENYEGPTTIGAYLGEMEQDTPAGLQFNYVTPMSEVLQALVVQVEGKPFEEVMSERLWSKLGTERDALILVEESQQALAGSGLMVTARDMARFGQMILNKGKFNGHQVLDEATVAHIAAGGDTAKFEAYGKGAGMDGMSYRAQWWHLENAHKAFMAMGVYGQYIYIDPVTEVVIVKQSAEDAAITEFSANNDFKVLDSVSRSLAAK